MDEVNVEEVNSSSDLTPFRPAWLDDPWELAAKAEMNRVATDEQLAMLNGDVEKWLQTLRVIHARLEATFGKRRAEFDKARAEMWPKGKAVTGEYLKLKAEYEDWRRRAGGFKRHLLTKLGDVKVAVRTQRGETFGDQVKMERDAWKTVAKVFVRVVRDDWEVDEDYAVEKILGEFDGEVPEKKVTEGEYEALRLVQEKEGAL